MSEQEKQLLQMVTQTLLPAYLDQQGYNVTTKDIPFEESSQAKTLNQNIQKAQDAYNSADAGMDAAVAKNKLSDAKKAYTKAQSAYIPTTGYTLDKKDPPYLEAVKKKYGSTSSEYTNAKSTYETNNIAKEKDLADIQTQSIANAKKFLNGDFSINDQQKAYIKDLYAPISSAIDKMTSDNLEQTTKTFEDFRKSVADTSLSVSQALDAVGTQIKQTGSDMKTALDTTIETNKALMKMGIEDKTGEITKRTNTLAASLGRSPTDPEFQKEIQTSVSREIERGTLNLADMQARGELSIAERTGSGLEGVARSKVNLAESTGNKLEDAAMQEGQQKGNIIGTAGSMRTNLASQTADTTFKMGANMPQQIQVGYGATQFDNAMIQQRLANAGAAMSAPTGVFGTFAGERYRQPTTTTERPWGVQDYIGTALGVGNLAMGAYTGMSQANAMRGLYSGGSGNSGGYGPNPGFGYNGDYGFGG